MKQRSTQLWFKRLLRSAAVSLICFVVLGAGFWGYWRLQPAAPVAITRAAPTAITTTEPTDITNAGIGPGGAPWVDDYDGGTLTSMFHARNFNPRPDGQFDVDHPVWVFYLSDGQYLLLTGESGLVHVDTDDSSNGKPNGSLMSPAVLQAPSSGTLQHVQVWLYPSKLATDYTLTFTTNNIAFDHDTLRLYTQAFTDESGKTVAADWVPVQVRGQDYDFDGYGLTMHWNDRDRRLQLLQIDHGKSLVVKHPNRMATPGSGAAAARDAAQDGAPLPEQLAEAPPGQTGTALAAGSKAQPPASSPTIYHALFEHDVRVFQLDRQMAAADDMGIDFLQGKQPTPATVPAAGSKAPTASPPVVATHPVRPDEPVELQPAAPPAAEHVVAGNAAPATAPATAPASEPITVTWSGQLRITPLDGPGALPLSPGQAVVRMVGQPVVLTPAGSTITAAAVVYRTGDSAGRLENSPAFPQVTLAQDHGSRFAATAVSYNPTTEIATIAGPGDLKLPVAADDPHAGTATVRWRNQGLVHVIARSGQPSTVDHVDLFGAVAIRHPQFQLDADALALDLQPAAPTTASATAPATPRMELRRVTATGSAACQLIQPGEPQRTISGDRLVLLTAPGPDGKPSPRQLLADGNVRAVDPSQEQRLNAGHLDVALAPKPPSATQPTTQPDGTPAVQVESVYASNAVHADLKGGSTADAAELRLTEPGGQQLIVLTGTPAQPARVSDGKKNDLSGPVIRIVPDTSVVLVDGPGTAHTDRRTSATQPSQPTAVTWSHDLLVQGEKNTVDVHGDVVATAIDAQGDHDRVVGDNAHADLMDTVPPPPAPLSHAATRPTTAPAGMGNKQIRDFQLTGSVVGNTLLTDPASGAILRRGELHGDAMTYDATAARGVVPGAGRLLVEDHRPPDAIPPTGTGDAPVGGSSRGSMAIEWAKSLTYDQPGNQITFDGDVHTGFRQATPRADLMQMDCQQMVVLLHQAPPVAGQPAPAGGPQQRMQVSSLLARGGVDFHAKDLRFTADTVLYDPATAELTARGSADVPGQTFNGASENTGTFNELVYNTRTELVESVNGLHGDFRH